MINRRNLIKLKSILDFSNNHYTHQPLGLTNAVQLVRINLGLMKKLFKKM